MGCEFCPMGGGGCAVCRDDQAEAAPVAPAVRTLYCSCCGGWTRGRQWHNRDTGYGLCASCADRITARGKMTAEEFTSCYGVRGVHF